MSGDRELGVRLRDVAAGFGISESCLNNWLKQADVEDGIRRGVTPANHGISSGPITIGDTSRNIALFSGTKPQCINVHRWPG
jgi:hypothetical protein